MKYLADLYTELVTVWFKILIQQLFGMFCSHVFTYFLKTFSHTLKYPHQEKRSAIQLDAFGIHFRKNGILSEEKNASGIMFTKNHLGPTARPHPSLSCSDVTAKASVISLSPLAVCWFRFSNGSSVTDLVSKAGSWTTEQRLHNSETSLQVVAFFL